MVSRALGLSSAMIVVACSASSKKPDDRIACEQYFDQVGVLTGVPTSKPYSKAELALCEAKTQEQLGCVMGSQELDDLGMCEIADTSKRARARRVWQSVKAAWPGTTDVMAVLQTTQGCAPFGIAPLESLDESQVVVNFVLRDATTAGDARRISARLRTDGNDWSCADTDPGEQCDLLRVACRAPVAGTPQSPPVP